MKRLLELTLGLALCQAAWCQPRIDALVTSSDLINPALGAGSLATAFCRGFSNFPSLTVGRGNPVSTSLAGVSVTVNGIAAPILAVAAGTNGTQQINFQVPYEIGGSFAFNELLTMDVAITFGGTTARLTQRAAYSAGEFFYIGKDPAIFHSDYSLVTQANPAKWGETLVAYATGLTITYPRVPTGTAAPVDEPLARIVDRGFRIVASVNFDYNELTIFYQGLAPGLVGVYQLNFILNAQDRPSGKVELYLVRDCGWFRCPPRTAAFSRRVPLPLPLIPTDFQCRALFRGTEMKRDLSHFETARFISKRLHRAYLR